MVDVNNKGPRICVWCVNKLRLKDGYLYCPCGYRRKA